MANEDSEQEIRRALDAVQVVQSMIDVSTVRLDGLRTQCATSAELTQQEIRTLEGKLIKLFSRQLVTKAKLREEEIPPELRNIPSLTQWLEVVGLSQDSIKVVCLRIRCLESLQEKSERELKVLLGNARDEEVRRLCRAIHNLKKYTEVLAKGGGAAGGPEADMALYWDSWDRHHLLRGSPRPRARHARASVPSEDALLPLPDGTPASHHHTPPHHRHQPHANSGGGSLPLPLSRSASSIAQPRHATPPPSPTPALSLASATASPVTPLTPLTAVTAHNSKGKAGVKFPTTPPARRKHQTGLPPPALLGEAPPLTKSKSHESQLGLKLDGEGNTPEGGQLSAVESTVQGRARLATEPGVPSSPLAPCSPIRSPPYRMPAPPLHHNYANADSDETFKTCNLPVPRSPRTPTVSRGMGHYIAHRFTKTFKMIATCDYCDKQMFLGAGLKCKECKYKCHRDCEGKVPPSCGLPAAFVDEFKRTVQSDSGSVFLANNSPSSGRSPQHTVGGGGILSSLAYRTRKRSHPHQINANVPSFPGNPDSSSNTSSCNSSTPSSPALLASGAQSNSNAGAPPNSGVPQTPHTPRTPHNSHGPPPPPPVCPPASHLRQQFHFPDVKKPWTATGNGPSGDRGASPGGSTDDDPDRTPGNSRQGSGRGGRGGRSDSADGDPSPLLREESGKWPRQNSLSMKEWDIPYDELAVGDPVGTGRFGTVYRGSWHGDVAVKQLNIHDVDNEEALESFKLEVATFRKTRHENLVLFMGACMKPPKLAIVTSLCKGMTLHTHIHLRKDKFNMNKTTVIAQQISQGMGYLHARGIVHKDLKSKNIFLENGKVVITDFGLFSVTKLCFGNSAGDSLGIPAGWLCYLAPELVRGLRPRQARHADDLPFSKASDVYAFGTVWYELLCGEWPFKGQPPEAVIWQVGKGVKQTLANLQASRDVKDILMLCWSYRVTERPDFGRLLSTLEKLPRKRLARSPSHPVHLSRSAESVF